MPKPRVIGFGAKRRRGFTAMSIPAVAQGDAAHRPGACLSSRAWRTKLHSGRGARRCVARTSCCGPSTPPPMQSRSTPSRTRPTATQRSGPICLTARTSTQTTCASCSPGPRVRRTRSSSPWCGCRTSVRSGWPPTSASRLSSRHRDRPHLVRRAAAADDRRDRGHLPAGSPRVRRPRLPPARVEVRRAKRRLAGRRRALRFQLRRRLSELHGDQGPQPGHRLVRDHRR